MSALDDLRNVETALDSAITGWIGYSWKATTKTGEKCLAMVATMRARHYRAWGENIALRARLSRALGDVNGLRDSNEQLTRLNELLERKRK